MQGLVPRYLEFAMEGFSRQQEQMKTAMERTIGGLIPFAPPGIGGGLEELGKQNMAMMERAMSLFTPFARSEARGEPPSVEALQAEIDRLHALLAAKDKKA